MAISGEKLARQLGQVWDDEDAGANDRVVADGIKVTELKGPFLDAFKDRLKGFDQDWVEKAKKAGVDGKAALDMFRKEVTAN